MTQKKDTKAKGIPLRTWLIGGLYVTAAVLTVIGIFLLWTWWATRQGTDRWLNGHDAILGIGNHTMLLLVGVLHLALATYLFAARDLLNRSLLVLWAGLNHSVYYAGVRFTEPMALLETERFIGWRLQLTQEAIDIRWKLLQVGLILLGLGAVTTILIISRKNGERLKQEQWFRKWQDNRTAARNRKIPEASKPVENYFKIVCASCGQKISFPISRTGENTACPRCAAEVTLCRQS